MTDTTNLKFPISFYSSGNSQAGKVRRGLWLGFLIGFILVAITSKGSVSTLLTIVIIGIAILLPLELYFRSQMRPGQPIVTLNQNSVESPVLSGKIKQLNWDEIICISIESQQNSLFLKFQLSDSPTHPDRTSLFDQNPAQPALSLHLLTPDEQQSLIAALQHGLEHFRTTPDPSTNTVIDSLAGDRELEARLKSLTPIPWITYTLAAVNILIWGVAIFLGSGIMQTPTEQLLQWGGNAASEVQRGEWWRMLTATFLHGGIMHLSMNMIGLLSIGIIVERIYGHRQFALIYFAAGLMGSALSLHHSAQSAVSVGASGAIFGLMGALFVGVYQHRKQLPSTFSKNMISSAGIFILYSLLNGFSKQGIDNAAHIGGLIGGATLAFMLPERFNMEHYIATWKKQAALGITLSVLATIGLAMTAPPAVIDQRMALAGQAAFQLAMKDFDIAVKAMQQDQQEMQANRMTEREADDRSRSVLAPLFRKAQQDFARATLPSTDPRLPILSDMRRMNDLLLEAMEMPSIYRDGSNKPEPADPIRSQEITSEIEAIALRIQRSSQALKAGKH
jgi:rhomboid protease GluP